MSTTPNPSTTTPRPSAGVLRAPLAELLDYLADLHGTLRQLACAADRKLAALRAADADALQACTVHENELLQTLFRAAQGRSAVLARLAQLLQCPDRSALRLTVIAERLPEPQASALRARSAALSEIAGELQQKNGLVARVAHNLQAHIRGVFAELAKASQQSSGYGPCGRPQMQSRLRWVDAIG